MEFYESTYFIILIPAVVITVIFLFFWLFMKETLYDEVLAKQKRDQKFAPAKTDKKKTDKKKNKKKEAQNGNLHESDSESTSRDFKLSDALTTDEEHLIPLPLALTESSSGIRERKKKEKKHKTVQDEHVPKESDGSKPSGKKVEPVPVTKQPTPPSDSAGSKKKPGQKKQKNGMDDQDAKNDLFVSLGKKQDPAAFHQEIKQESASGKKKVSAKKQKVDNALVDEPLIQATTYIPLMDNSELNPLVEKREVADLAKQDINEGLQKSSTKKLKNETDKENAEVKFKDFLLAMKSMIFTEEEALSVVELLKEKSTVVQDVLQKASKGDSAAMMHQLQDKDKMLAAMKEEAAVAREQCKQLTQELVTEKERNNLVTAKMRERINTLEKEHGTFQSKMHVGYQEAQQMKIKFQQLREQMEAEISHLKQENGILRDAVSTSTNQMESKQSAELNKLRQEYARLVNELGEKNNKLQQEELQKKNAEQAVAQLKVQQQEAERRWEEIQTFLRKRTAEHEAAQQDVQNKLVAKDNEIQSLHSKLTDTMVSKQQLEQRMLQLMEAEQKRVTAEESMQMQVQELLEQNEALKTQLQKFHSQMAAQVHPLVRFFSGLVSEKDKQIKQMEETLANEHASLTSKEEEFKVNIFNCFCLSFHMKDDKIRTLEEQLQEDLAQITNTKEEFKVLCTAAIMLIFNTFFRFLRFCIREKDDKIKTVEELLEAGLIEVANKEEELKVLRTENSSLKNEVQNLQSQQIHEKDGKIKSVEELLQAEILKVANKEKTVQVLLKYIAGKETELTSLRNELAFLGNAVEQQRKKNNDLREKNWKAMEALASTEKLLQDRVNKTAKERQQYMEAAEMETRELLQKLFPKVSLPSNLVMEQKLKEAEEMHIMLQLECEKYKAVLAETEGILQRLQRSVEEEESKWKVKIEDLQKELRQVFLKSSLGTLSFLLEIEEREHLESELEKAELERSTYVSEVRELKTQLSETLSKLKIDQNERQKLAGDLPKVSEACRLVIDSNTIKCLCSQILRSGGLLG
uniref:Kinectin 1 n=1 Tax=Crocodylus porosus TaxID=8502 RepID=A0A7M4FIL5_CROPO